MPYYPQGLLPFNKVVDARRVKHHEYSFGRKSHKAEHFQQWTNYPKSILKFTSVTGKDRQHPTQKPVPLLEYLIKTYTNEGETVLDNCMGSGSTGVACINTGRNFIGIEKDEKYFQIASERIANAQCPSTLQETPPQSA
jgi:site-specific DNA-methyltransferase (adenine-specific)